MPRPACASGQALANSPRRPPARPAAARLGHGSRQPVPLGPALAEAGLSRLLVDLRGHGESGDAAPGYGRREAEDLVELISALDADAQLPGALHLFGVSYGGATAAHLSARLPERIASVVLLEPFANAADAIREMVPTLLASSDPRLWQRISRSLLRLRFSPERVEQAIAGSSERLGLDLESVDLAPPAGRQPGLQAAAARGPRSPRRHPARPPPGRRGRIDRVPRAARRRSHHPAAPARLAGDASSRMAGCGRSHGFGRLSASSAGQRPSSRGRIAGTRAAGSDRLRSGRYRPWPRLTRTGPSRRGRMVRECRGLPRRPRRRG
jgi:pimeloyl-ACP methyl ester carboxylesterase